MIGKHLFIWCAITQLVVGCASTHHTQDYVQVIKGSAVEFEMVWIPQGNFWIGRTEVTWDEFLQYCDFDQNAAVPPGATVAPDTKSVPVIVIAVPPAGGPLVGLTAVTVGGGS